MNLRSVFQFCGLALVSAAAAHGQIAATLQLAKTQYVAGEAVMATVTVTNHAGQDLTFRANDRQPWLDFVIKNNGGEPAIPSGHATFGSVVVPVGQSMSRQVNLSTLFNLAEMGSFSVYGVVRNPNDPTEETSTNRLLFNVTNGRPYWTQKVGVKGDSTKTREFRVLNYSGDQKTELYVQVLDGRTGTAINTFSLGAALMFQKPQITVDRNQVLHVFFLASPTMWMHATVDTNGKLLDRSLHLRPATGDPTLMTQQDGSVTIENSIPYDPQLEAEARAKIHKISDRPAIQH